MIAAVETGKTVWTDADLQALPEDGFIHELVDGKLTTSPKNVISHGDICVDLLVALSTFARAKRLGQVFDSSTGFRMANGNCRAPDVSFVSRARLTAAGFRRSTGEFFPGAPDLAVEVLSPNNTHAEMRERLGDFFASGTRIAWLINPATRSAEVCHSPARREIISSAGFLAGEDILPGFQFPVADLFKEWDWE